MERELYKRVDGLRDLTNSLAQWQYDAGKVLRRIESEQNVSKSAQQQQEARLNKLDPPPPANRIEVFQQPYTGMWMYSLYLNGEVPAYNSGAYDTKAAARKAALDHHKRLTKPEIEVIPL